MISNMKPFAISFLLAICVAASAKDKGLPDSYAAIAAKIYDAQIGGFSNDGAFDPTAIDVIRRSLKELGILPTVPEAKSIYSDKFVPVQF